MAKHEPGPWTAHHNGYCWQIDAAMDAVATTQFCYASETEGNARLIAAAPDLLEALKKLLVFAEAAETKALVGHEGCLWPVEEARAAIAKAEGR